MPLGVSKCKKSAYYLDFLILCTTFVGKILCMTDEEKTISLFSTRVRQMLFEFDKLKKENEHLRGELVKREGIIKEVDAKLKLTQQNYESLMTAKMLEVSEGDMEAAKARLSKLIRSVNKCITLLSEK